jgi:O-antigen ligase
MSSIKRLVLFSQLLILLLILSVIPLINFPFLEYGFEFSKYLILILLSGILFLSNGLYLLLNQKIKIEPIITIPLVFYVLVFGISTFLSLNPLMSFMGRYGSFYGGFSYLLLLLNVFAAVTNLKSEKKLLLQAIFISGVSVSLFGLWQYFDKLLHTGNMMSRISASIGQPNRLAFFLISIIPIGYFLILSEKKKIIKLFYIFGWFSSLLCFFFTFSRTSFFSLILLMALYLIINKNNIQKIVSHKAIVCFTLVIVIFFGVILSRSVPSTVKNFSQSSLRLRFAEWEAAWNGIVKRNLKSHIAGYGPDTAYITYFRNRPQIYNYSAEEFATGPVSYRNYYLHILSTLGFLGLAAYLFFYFCLFAVSYRGLKKDSDSEMIFYGLASIAITSFFYYQIDLVMIIFMVFAGLLGRDVEVAVSKPGKIICGTVLLMMGMIVFIKGVDLAKAQWYYHKGRSEENFTRVLRYNSFYDVYFRNISLFYSRLALQNLDMKNENTQKNINLSIGYAQKAFKLIPQDLRNIRNLMSIQYQFGVNFDKKYQYENLNLIEKLTTAAPTDPRTYDLAGLIYLNLGDLKNARKNFEKEIELYVDSPTPYLHLGEVAKQQGFLEEALKLHQKAVDLSPGWDFAENELNKTKKLLFKE